MASQSGVRAGRAYFEVRLEDHTDKDRKKIEGQMRAWGNRMAAATRVAAGTAAGGVGLGFAINSFARLDDVVRLAGAAAGAQESKYRDLMDITLLLGRTTVFTAGEIGDMILVLSRAGETANASRAEILKLSSDVTKLARATGTELNQAAEILIGTLNGFQMGVDQSTEAIDLLVTAVNNAPLTLEDFHESLKLTGTTAGQTKQELVEIAAAIGVLAKGGQKGSLVGTAMVRGMIEFAQPDKQKKLRKMGVEVADANGKMRAFSDILGDLDASPVFRALSDLEQTAFLVELFGDRAVKNIPMLMRNGAQQLKDFVKELRNSGGAAEKAFGFGNKSLQVQVLLLTSALDGLVKAIGQRLASPFRVFSFVLRQVIGLVTLLVNYFPLLGWVIMGAATVIGTLVAAWLAATAVGWGYWAAITAINSATAANIWLTKRLVQVSWIKAFLKGGKAARFLATAFQAATKAVWYFRLGLEKLWFLMMNTPFTTVFFWLSAVVLLLPTALRMFKDLAGGILSVFAPVLDLFKSIFDWMAKIGRGVPRTLADDADKAIEVMDPKALEEIRKDLEARKKAGKLTDPQAVTLAQVTAALEGRRIPDASEIRKDYLQNEAKKLKHETFGTFRADEARGMGVAKGAFEALLSETEKAADLLDKLVKLAEDAARRGPVELVEG